MVIVTRNAVSQNGRTGDNAKSHPPQAGPITLPSAESPCALPSIAPISPGLAALEMRLMSVGPFRLAPIPMRQSARMSWPLQKDENVLQKVRDANKLRLSKQPLDMPSCGSVFKNPEGHKVAQLIDQCGLKRFRMGDAQVSTKHANFIVNLNKATAIDTWNIILHVQKTVKEKTGIDIQTEVVRLGEW